MKRFPNVLLAIVLSFCFVFVSLVPIGIPVVAQAAGDDAENAAEITSGETIEGSLDLGQIEHWYFFETSDDSKAELELTFQAKLDGRILLYDSELVPIQSFDDNLTEGKETGTAYLEGNEKYYIQVLTSNLEEVTLGSEDKYTLKLVAQETTISKDQNEPNNAKAQATKLTLGEQVYGNVMASGDEDIYKIDLASKGDLELTLKAPEDLDVGILFFDSEMAEPWDNSNYIRGADYGSEGDDETLRVWIEKPGTYYVLVGSPKGAASPEEYTLSTKLNAIKTFADIKDHWAREEIEPLATRGVIEGMKADVFAPESKVTRAQFATMLVRALGIEEYDGAEEGFTDVKKDEWYFKYVEAAATTGIVNGYTDGSFRPNANITREQMAAMIVRAMDLVGFSADLTTAQQDKILAGFTDKAQVSSWAKKELAAAVDSGIVNGVTEKTLVPAANAKRAEAAAMIKRMMEQTGLL